MKFILLGSFTLIVAFVWIFYVILSIHAKKFSKFSTVIDRNLSLLFIFLLVLTISGYLIIIFGNLSNFTSNIFGETPNSVRVENYDIQRDTTY